MPTLVRSKLHAPPPRLDLVPRPRLLAQLSQAQQHDRCLTLISAPAGYGKTTLVAEWIARFQFPTAEPSASEKPVAWLALDEGDNDPALFLTYLIAALQRLQPSCGATARTLLTSLTNPGAQVRQVVGVLINDILEMRRAPCVLVLDDAHLITEPSVFAALDYALEQLPPQMRVVVSARHDPPLALPRLRARGRLAELRVADLRFTLDETTIFLNAQLKLDLAPDDLTILQTCTEGWPAGLRLLANSLERIPTTASRRAFIQNLAQTDRYVFDFLAEEVLNCQTRDRRAFLLETAILPELTPALCQAVTGREDAAALLDDLDRRNLFLVNQSPLSSPQTPAYRYHALFAEFLRERLAQEMPERVRDLHGRAAEAETNPSRAISHYLAAEQWDQAAQRIEAIGAQLLQQGLLDTLAGWVRALPIPIRDAHPQLIRLLGACAFWKGDFQTAQPLLERTVEGFQAIGDQAGVGESLADLASSAFLQSDFARAGALIERALGYALPPRCRGQMLMARAWLRFFGGERARAAADLESAVAVAETGKPEVLLMLAFYIKSQLAALPGGLECIERFCRLATPHLGEPNSPLRAAVQEIESFSHFWRGRLDQAIQVGMNALAINERLGGYPFLGQDAAATVAVAYAARGDYANADRFFETMLRQARQMPLSQAGITGVLWIVGHARWLQNRLEEAREIYAQMCAAACPAELPEAPAVRLRMQGLLELADRRYAAAEQTWRQALALDQKYSIFALEGNVHLLLAHLYLIWNRPRDALAELAPVLADCEQHGTPGLILREGAAIGPALRLAIARNVHASFAARLLELLGVSVEPRPVLVPETGETLTPREVEILKLIAAGASNRAIAERLVVGEGTVKSHLHHIFRKLDVASRTEAVARARALRLV